MVRKALLMLIPIFAIYASDNATAQMSMWQDSNGTVGQSFDLGNGMGMWSDNRGRQGSYMDMGKMGMYQDNQGTQGQWFDLNERLRSFQDNKGGTGQMFSTDEHFGQFLYHDPAGRTQQGFFQQLGQ